MSTFLEVEIKKQIENMNRTDSPRIKQLLADHIKFIKKLKHEQDVRVLEEAKKKIIRGVLNNDSSK